MKIKIYHLNHILPRKYTGSYEVSLNHIEILDDLHGLEELDSDEEEAEGRVLGRRPYDLFSSQTNLCNRFNNDSRKNLQIYSNYSRSSLSLNSSTLYKNSWKTSKTMVEGIKFRSLVASNRVPKSILRKSEKSGSRKEQDVNKNIKNASLSLNQKNHFNRNSVSCTACFSANFAS